MENVTIQVKGMSCEGCQAAVEKALTSLSGVASADVSLEGGLAKVTYDSSKVGSKDFKTAVEDAGFEVE